MYIVAIVVAPARPAGSADTMHEWSCVNLCVFHVRHIVFVMSITVYEICFIVFHSTHVVILVVEVVVADEVAVICLISVAFAHVGVAILCMTVVVNLLSCFCLFALVSVGLSS